MLRKPSNVRLSTMIWVVLLVQLNFSCGDSGEVSIYSIPKAKAKSQGPHWEVPEGWKPGKESAMRVGSFSVSDDNGSSLDISVTAFPGDTGGLLANVNRWLGQIDLQPVDEGDLENYVTETEVDNPPAPLVQAENDGKSLRVLAVTVHDKTWFFKMMGDFKLAEKERETFDKFVHSTDFHFGHNH